MSGPRAAQEPGEGAGSTQQRYRGERFGLPESGVGSVPSTARRAVAMLIDCVLAALITGLFTMPDLPRNWSLLTWFLIGVIAVSFFGFTPGMYAIGTLEVLGAEEPSRPGNVPVARNPITWWQSRKKTLYVFYIILTVFIALFFVLKGGGNALNMYLLCMGLGFGAGISVLYITMSAEQFGTNLRASAAISIPNMVRGALPLIILLFKFTRNLFGSYITGGWITGAILFAIAISAAWFTEETFGKDLDFVER